MEPVDITTEPAPDAPDPASARRSGFVAACIVVAAVAVVVAAIVVPLFGEQSESSRPADDAMATPAPAPTVPAPIAGSGDDADSAVSVPTDLPTPAPTPPGARSFPPNPDHLRLDHIEHVFENVLDSEQLRYGLAYRHDGEMRVVDARGVSGTFEGVAMGLQDLVDVTLLTDEAQTWAIDAADRRRSFLVSANYEVVDVDRAGTLAVVRRRPERTTVDLLADGLPYATTTLPSTTEVIAVDGRGVLLMPRSGGTYELGPLDRQPLLIFEDRAVAASRGVTILEACDQRLRCSLTAVSADSGSIPLDGIDPGAALTPSPDGRFVVIADGSGAQLRNLESGESVSITGPAVDAVAWSDDSRFVVLVRAETAFVHLVGGGDAPTEIDLAEAPDEGVVVVFSTPVG